MDSLVVTLSNCCFFFFFFEVLRNSWFIWQSILITFKFSWLNYSTMFCNSNVNISLIFIVLLKLVSGIFYGISMKNVFLGTLRKPMFPLPCSITLAANVPALGTENKTYLSSHAYPHISIMPLVSLGQTDKQQLNWILYDYEAAHIICTLFVSWSILEWILQGLRRKE